jgi:hypothetical protein
MKSPFVSRGRLEAAEQTIRILENWLASARSERDKYLDLLLDKGATVPTAQTVEEDDSKTVRGYTTPFDRLTSRFDDARRQGPIPEKFKVRLG